MSNKKDYVKNAKVGDILTESALKDFKDQSNSRKSTLTKFDGINYKIETIGTISNMKYSKNFEDTVTDFMSKVMDFIKEQKEFNKNQIGFNNKIMSLPTIKKELSELPKNKK